VYWGEYALSVDGGASPVSQFQASGYTATDKKKGQPVKVGLDSLGTRMAAGFR
jgi:hypothetical protein